LHSFFIQSSSTFAFTHQRNVLSSSSFCWGRDKLSSVCVYINAKRGDQWRDFSNKSIQKSFKRSDKKCSDLVYEKFSKRDDVSFERFNTTADGWWRVYVCYFSQYSFFLSLWSVFTLCYSYIVISCRALPKTTS
jgi:hypothetical protein